MIFSPLNFALLVIDMDNSVDFGGGLLENLKKFLDFELDISKTLVFCTLWCLGFMGQAPIGEEAHFGGYLGF